MPGNLLTPTTLSAGRPFCPCWCCHQQVFGRSFVYQLTPTSLRLSTSLLRKEGEKKSKTLFARSEERVVERSKDRVSKLRGGISNLPNTYRVVTNKPLCIKALLLKTAPKDVGDNPNIGGKTAALFPNISLRAISCQSHRASGYAKVASSLRFSQCHTGQFIVFPNP